MPISIPGTFQPDGGPYGTGLISGADWLAPFVWVTSGFGAAEPWRVNPPPAGFGFGTHGGDDLAWSGCYGQPIRAWQTCSVTSAGWEPVGGWILGVDLGIGDDDVHERVAFYHTLEPIHAVGDIIQPGEVIAYVGNTGSGISGKADHPNDPTYGAHIHAVRYSEFGDGQREAKSFVGLITGRGLEAGLLPDRMMTLPVITPLVRDVVTGSWPPGPQDVALIATVQSCTPEEIVAEAASEGCTLAAIARLSGGVWSMYLVGAPPAINAGFGTLPDGIGLWVRAA